MTTLALVVSYAPAVRGLMCSLALLGAGVLAAQTEEYERARRLLASGHSEQAAAIYQEMLRGDPTNANLLLNLSIAEYKSRHFHEAAASAEAALKSNPGLSPASLLLGASYLELGDFLNAIGPLESGVSAMPRDRNGRLLLGEALLGAGRPAAALEHLQAASEMVPADPRVWYALGQAYEALGQTEAAHDAWRRLETLPPSLQSHLHAAAVHNSEQRWRAAAAEWKEALKLAPENLSARQELAWALFRSRDYEASLAALKPVLTTAPGAEIQFLYGASLLNLQQPLEAMPYLRSALAAAPDLLPASAALGQALLQTGKVAEAIPLLQRALPVDADGSIHFQLFRAYQLTHRKAEAEQALAAYQRLRESLVPAP